MADTTRLNMINTSRILQSIWKQKGISRIEIAEKMGLDRSTVTKIVQNLQEKKLVKITGKEASREGLGRKPIGLSINTDIGFILGLELQTQQCRGMVIDLDGTVKYSLVKPFDPEKMSIPGILKNTVDEVRKKMEETGRKIMGIGIGLSGLVDPYKGIILQSNPFRITDSYHLKTELENVIPEPVLIENDANCCCWGELAFRKGTRDRNFMVILGEFRNTDIDRYREKGIAVGLGLVIRERVLHGDDFTAGEFRSLLHEEPNITQFSISDEEAVQLPVNKEVLTKVFDEIARNISLIVNCMNFTRIIFAGALSFYESELKPIMGEMIRKNWLYNSDKKCFIDFSPFGENSVAFGAAGLFVEKLFAVPDISDRPDEEVGMILFDRILRV